MNTYRTHTKLSSALRSLNDIRDELQSEQTSWFEKVVCQARWFFFRIRVRQLIERLHSR